MTAEPRRSATAAEMPAEELTFGLLHAAGTLTDRLENRLASVGSSLAKHGVLTTLVELGEPVALSELASSLGCVRSNITQLVDRLEAEGLVRRVHDAQDRRSVRAVLTPAGRRRQTEGAAEIGRVAADFSSALSARDRKVLERLLHSME